MKVPSEFHFSEKWDSLIEQSLIRSAVGLAAGGLAGLVLSSEWSSYVNDGDLLWDDVLTRDRVGTGRGNVRMAMAAFGAGVGIGSAYTKTAMEFDEEKMNLDKRH